MQSKKEELRQMLLKILKESREKEKPKETPARPGIKTAPAPDPTPVENPERRLTPDDWPEDAPGPKPKAKAPAHPFSINEILKNMRLAEELTRMKSLISENAQIHNEMAMTIDDPEYDEPHPSVRAGIEGDKKTAFTDSDFFSGGQPDYSTLEKIGSEEFNKIIADVKPFGKMGMGDFMQVFKLIETLEKPHYPALEKLAVKKVAEQFGLPKSVSDKLVAKMVTHVQNPDEDTDNLVQDVPEDLNFTEEEKEIIRKHVDKRKVQNALMMGAGYKGHSTFNSIKEELDTIEPKLYPLYQKTMPNVSLFMWKFPWEDMMGEAQMMGISKLKKDENNKVKAYSYATLFPILLHETTKAAIELLFANYLIDLTKRYGKNVAGEIIKQSDVFGDEIWMKRIGPTLWKYLHDIIDFVVKHDRNGDYKIVAYLLNKISLMEPDEFLTFMNNVVYSGKEALASINSMINEIEMEIAAYEKYKSQTPAPKDIEKGETINTSALSDELNKLAIGVKEKEAATPAKPKSYEEMDIAELNAELAKAIEDERYEEAAKIATIIKTK